MTERPRLWVIDPSIHEPEDQCVEQVLEGWPGESRVFRPALSPGDGPAPGDGYDVEGAVILGSSVSVHDELPWLTELTRWLDPLLDGTRHVPLLGICFGHQLVAHRAGAEVGNLRPDGDKEVGCMETLVEGARLLPGTHRLKVVVSHRETVKTVPRGYRVVARRPGVPLDGFEHERLHVFTFQFHPEARDEFVTRRGLNPGSIDARLIEDSNRLLAAFRAWVLSRAKKKRAGGGSAGSCRPPVEGENPGAGSELP